MTRILVCGASTFSDPGFVHETLNEVNTTYGPVTCVIHANYLPGLVWQQWVAQAQVTRHLPITPRLRDGAAMYDRWRDRMFDEGRPDMLLVVDDAEKGGTERDEKTTLLVMRALHRSIPVLTYVCSYRPSQIKPSRRGQAYSPSGRKLRHRAGRPA